MDCTASAPKYAFVGEGTSSRVFEVGPDDTGRIILRKPYDAAGIVDNEVYKLSETEQLLEVLFRLRQVGHPLADLVWIKDGEQQMVWKGPTLDKMIFISEDTLRYLGYYVRRMCNNFQDVGIAMPDWKPANVCAAPVIKLTYGNVYAKGSARQVQLAITKATKQIRAIVAAERAEFEHQMLSVELARPSFTDDAILTVVFEQPDTADVLMERGWLANLAIRSVLPDVEIGTEYTVIDYNALYVMDTANCANKDFRPARGTYCPYGADYEQLHENREVMLYGMWFAAACLMAWARLRCNVDHFTTDTTTDEFTALTKACGGKYRPATVSDFFNQHDAVQKANRFPGGITMPDPAPVARFLQQHRILMDSV